MDMEHQEEIFISSVNNYDLTQIAKGKRTKRQRSISPHKAAPAVTSTSSSGCGGGYGSISSPTSNCSEVYESTEEEDMANCLILLAQGEGPKVQASNKFANTTTNKAGYYVYECKTCNRSFPSFQALGGHRASHKKPKPTVIDEKKPPLAVAPPVIDDNFDDHCQLNKTSTCSTNLDHHHHHHLISLQKGILGNNNSKSKIHECSICGSEFSSGQALGGHMRRHRAITVNNSNNNIIINQVNINVNIDDDNNIQTKPKNILSLDLNLPAPEDDHHHRETKFQFASATTKQALVFSAAPALVDCHY